MIDPNKAFETEAARRRRELTIHRTSQPDCPACQAGRLHDLTEWFHFHPEAGGGIFEGREMPATPRPLTYETC